MDESELLALLAGVRTTPIFVCHLATRLVRLLGASTTRVLLSPQTMAKEEAKHRAANHDLYKLAATILASPFVRIDEKTKRLIFVWHSPKDARGKVKSYKAVVKATANGRELYLMSVHRMDRTSVRSVFKRTKSLEEWVKESAV